MHWGLSQNVFCHFKLQFYNYYFTLYLDFCTFLYQYVLTHFICIAMLCITVYLYKILGSELQVNKVLIFIYLRFYPATSK